MGQIPHITDKKKQPNANVTWEKTGFSLQRLQTMQIKLSTSLLILSGFAFSGDDGEMVMKTAVAKSRCGGDDVTMKST
ncbi:hypothetical protein YC2023_043177 [Brassica napus]